MDENINTTRQEKKENLSINKIASYIKNYAHNCRCSFNGMLNV